MTSFVVSNESKQQNAQIYDLYAVSNHYGSLAFGHYTAYCKNAKTNKWYDFNDSSVSALDDGDSVCTGAAYVLYYKRRDFFPDNQIDFNSIKLKPDDQEDSNLNSNGNT